MDKEKASKEANINKSLQNMYKNEDLKRAERDMLRQFSEMMRPLFANLAFKRLSEDSHMGCNAFSKFKKGELGTLSLYKFVTLLRAVAPVRRKQLLRFFHEDLGNFIFGLDANTSYLDRKE